MPVELLAPLRQDVEVSVVFEVVAVVVLRGHGADAPFDEVLGPADLGRFAGAFDVAEVLVAEEEVEGG